MKENILDLINKYWRFDENQQPISSFRDKNDLLKCIEQLFVKSIRGGVNKGKKLRRCRSCGLNIGQYYPSEPDVKCIDGNCPSHYKGDNL